MDISFGLLMAGLVFGSLGVGYFIYGKKQADWTTLMAGIALCIVPYFISSLLVMILVCAGIAAVPFIIRRWF